MASLGYKATVTAKNTHARTDKHTSTLTTEASQQRQRRLIQTEGGETDVQGSKAAARTKKTECTRTQQQFSSICVFLFTSQATPNLNVTHAEKLTHKGV